jgi:predicted permease
MRGVRRFWLRTPWTTRRRQRDLDDELQSFVDELTARNIARGMTPDSARRAALIETGGLQQVREATRDVWTLAPLEALLRDMRYGGRLFARTPGFSFIVVATLALVIGANATVFSVMYAVLWRALPYPDPARLVVVDAEVRGAPRAGLAGGETLDLQAEPHLFDGLAYIIGVDAHLTIDGEMERVAAVSASDDALPLLGAVPMAWGRPLQETRDGGLNSTIRSVVISYQLWQRRLGSDPAAVGRRIEVNNIDAEIVGVLPPDFRVYLPPYAVVAESPDVWFPTGFEADRRSRGPITIGRLASGVTLEAAQARLDAVAERFRRDHPADYADGGLRLSVAPLAQVLTADVNLALWVLAGAVAFVLVIGCVNIGNLLLARARARSREMAMRRALGAGRLRLVRQLLAEAAVLSALGAVGGFILALAGVSLVEWLSPAHLPRQHSIQITVEVAAFTALLAIGVCIVFAVLPAFASRGVVHESLASGRAAVQHRGIRRLQRGMVIAQVALSIVPLVAAGLMLRTFANLTSAPLGFETAHLVSAKVAYSLRAFPRTADRWRLHREVVDRVAAVPGVEEVSAGGPPPFDDWLPTRLYGREGDATTQSRATIQSVMPGYLRVTRTRLLAGREFTDDDIEQQRPVVIIDARMAAQLWPEGAIGQRLAYGSGRPPLLLEVIGVTEPVRALRVREDRVPHFFVPYHLFAVEQALVMRTRETAAAIGPAVKRAVESLGTRRPVYDIRPLQAYADASLADTRFMMLVLAGFGLASIALAAVGLYGTLAYLTSLRTQEFGVRMALGASAWQVLRAVTGEGIALAAAGAALGLAGALAATGALRGLLYNVTPFDGVTLAAVVGIVSATALVASIHPAWRASRTNPMHVLRAGE